tara:strand:- start:299 stop:502 length:204 start_codon:yes stop_codon:yes gene_type:complete
MPNYRRKISTIRRSGNRQQLGKFNIEACEGAIWDFGVTLHNTKVGGGTREHTVTDLVRIHMEIMDQV